MNKPLLPQSPNGDELNKTTPQIPPLVPKPPHLDPGAIIVEPIDIVDEPDDIFGDNIFNETADDNYFNEIPRTLIVNDQPFLRWLQRVSISLAVMSVIIVGITIAVNAPLQIGLMSVAATWIIILAITAPEAIIPFKKTIFDITNQTVKVGQKKERPIKDINSGRLVAKKGNSKLWLSFSDSKKDGFYAPLKSSKFSLKPEELLALKAIIPYTSIPSNENDLTVFEEKKIDEKISKTSLLRYINSL